MNSSHSWKLCFVYICLAAVCGAVPQLRQFTEVTSPPGGKFRVNRRTQSGWQGFSNLFLKRESRNECKFLRSLCMNKCNVRQLMCEEKCEVQQACDCRSAAQLDMRICKDECKIDMRDCLRSRESEKYFPPKEHHETTTRAGSPILDDIESLTDPTAGDDVEASPCPSHVPEESPEKRFRTFPNETDEELLEDVLEVSPEGTLEPFPEESSEPCEDDIAEEDRDELALIDAMRHEPNSRAEGEDAMNEVTDTPSISPRREFNSNDTRPDGVDVISISP